MIPSLRFFFHCAFGAALLLDFAARGHAETSSAFGSRKRVTPALVGIFYDLKQTQERTPVPKIERLYSSIIDNFLNDGLHEHDLDTFFRAGLPLYATQIALPQMDAGLAPKAFGVEKIVKPRYWIVQYKGQIAPPETGTYRFVGNSDDVLAVAINGKVVLVANHPATHFPHLGWRPPKDQGPKFIAAVKSEVVTYGDWLDLQADQPVDIDIIVGERPGGVFHAWLFYQKKDATYPSKADGKLILPLFQVAPLPSDSHNYLTNLPPWRCLE